MRIAIRGHNLPGRSFCEHTNVHVAVQVRKDPEGLVRGDAAVAEWDVDVTVADGPDFRGPAVHGKKGERFLYLTWGEVDADGWFHMFRRAKLMLHDIDPALLGEADAAGTLVATVDLTDDCGGPRCARVRPPHLEWSVGG